MVRNRKNKLDGVDLANLRALLESPAWQLVSERVLKTLVTETEDLVRPHDAVETATIRGRIAGLRLGLSVPKILVDEALANIKGEADDGVG